MKSWKSQLLAAAALSLLGAATLAADEGQPVNASAYKTPLLDNGPARSDQEEYDNKALGLLFHRTFFAEGDPQLAADLIMDPNFINHDVEESSGGQGFA